MQTASNWKGVWPYGINAILKINEKTCYFFKKNQCIKYNIHKKEADSGYPQPISKDWKGLWDMVEGAVRIDNDKALFFRKENVILYDLNKQAADKNFPMPFEIFLKTYYS